MYKKITTILVLMCLIFSFCSCKQIDPIVSLNESSEISIEVQNSSYGSVEGTNVLYPGDIEFQKIYNMLYGIYYDFIDHVDNGECYTPADSLKIKYNEEEDQYQWIRAYGLSGAVPGEFDKIIYDKETKEYSLFADDVSNEIIFSIIDEKIKEIKHYGTNFKKLDTPVNDYINARFLIGTYIDQDGKEYRFTSDHEAVWPERTFNYILFDWDYWESFGTWVDCNPICVFDRTLKNTTEEYFGYKVVDNNLLLYKVKFDGFDSFYRDEEPFVTLEKKG